MSKYVRWAVSLAVVLVLCVGWAPAATALYGGQQTYGTCTYGGDCAATGGSSGDGAVSGNTPSADPATIVQLSFGLEVAINLHDGQLIPRSGYTITVTPLNGRGTTFKQAMISIETDPPALALPATTGTASWLWLPREQPGTHVSVEVDGQNGQTIVRHFTVRLVDKVGTVVGTTSVTAASGGVSGAIRKALRAWPRPLAVVFPYIIFVLLGLDILLLFIQTSRELTELRAARRRLKRLELMAGMKRTFTELASHYLRTPLTLIEGGLEELAGTPAAAAAQASTTQLQASVTQLIDHARQRDESVELPRRAVVSPRWTAWLPLAVAAGLAVLFDYLADHVAELALGKVTLVMQLVVVLLLGVLLYMAERAARLHRGDVQAVRMLLTQKERLGELHEQFVRETLTQLDVILQRLTQQTAALPSGQATTFVLDGVQRLKTLIAKFAIAAQLQGARSTAPFVRVSVGELVAPAWRPLEAAAAAKHVVLGALPAFDFACQSPHLLTLVCSHLLDNAVAYSKAGSEITLAAENRNGVVTISVTNCGEPIPEVKRAILLEPFAKSEGAETFNHEGMGFSLYLDKLVLAYCGGALGLASDASGTTVSFSLPTAPRTSKHQAPARGADTSQMPWPKAAKIAHAAPMVDLDEVNS